MGMASVTATKSPDARTPRPATTAPTPPMTMGRTFADVLMRRPLDADGDCHDDIRNYDADVPSTTACNYSADATDDAMGRRCEFWDEDAPAVPMPRPATTTTPPPSTTVLAPRHAGLDCAGNCLADADGDGICDEDEVGGCPMTVPATTTTPPPTMMDPAPMRMLVTTAMATASAMPMRTAFATGLTRATIPT